MKADLSIIITNFNKTPAQLEECIQSVRDQTIEPKEVILVDDGSKEPHAHYGAMLSVIVSKNSGVAKARDYGVRISTGKLLLFLDADDKLNPDFIQQCGKQIMKADIVYPNLLLFGELERNKLSLAPATIRPTYFLGRDCRIPVTSMMWRKVYEDLKGFRDLPIFEDWDFWIRAACKGYTFRRANTLLWYRQNKNSRNHATKELKSSIHHKITAPYEVRDGKVHERKLDGSKTPQVSPRFG